MQLATTTTDNAVSIVDSLLETAIARSASDIHLESTLNGLVVRYRIDDLLCAYQTYTPILMPQIISRIKIMSAINIAERRVPQDGKFCARFSGREVDLRVSTFPSIHGEKVVVRILDRAQNNIDLDQLGLQIPLLAAFHQLISRASGFVLVTGPTGSGKTTSLYAALAELASPDRNIVTLEDPVEYTISGITQGQIHPDAGFTFERGIRALLRQDPDIIMVGEIRDKQTARVAIEAALTGHVVLSTLHTNDAPGALMRLMDMGIEPFLINAAVTGIMAQRLVRKICPSCRVQDRPTVHESALLKKHGLTLDSLYKGTGCASCFKSGYKGRTGIFELLSMSNQLRALIVKQPVFDAIYHQALTDGMYSLMDDAVQKLKNGVITLQELVRVLN